MILPGVRQRGMYARVEPSFELFDHTADMGLRIRAPSLDALPAPAAQALYAAIGTLVPGETVETAHLELRDETDVAYLLRDYLAELLVAFDRDANMAAHIDHPILRPGLLSVEVRWAKVDQDRSVLHREVKAITYHELGIRTIPGGVEATVIVDI